MAWTAHNGCSIKIFASSSSFFQEIAIMVPLLLTTFFFSFAQCQRRPQTLFPHVA
jgi:hypothetical protein